MNLEKLYQEMLEEKPYEVFLEPRPQIPTDLIEIQENDIFKEFIKAKRRKSEHKCFYICSTWEKF